MGLLFARESGFIRLALTHTESCFIDMNHKNEIGSGEHEQLEIHDAWWVEKANGFLVLFSAGAGEVYVACNPRRLRQDARQNCSSCMMQLE